MRTNASTATVIASQALLASSRYGAAKIFQRHSVVNGSPASADEVLGIMFEAEESCCALAENCARRLRETLQSFAQNISEYPGAALEQHISTIPLLVERSCQKTDMPRTGMVEGQPGQVDVRCSWTDRASMDLDLDPDEALPTLVLTFATLDSCGVPLLFLWRAQLQDQRLLCVVYSTPGESVTVKCMFKRHGTSIRCVINVDDNDVGTQGQTRFIMCNELVISIDKMMEPL